MYYITVKQPPQYHQMTLEEFLFGTNVRTLISSNTTNTRTYEVECVSDRFLNTISINRLIAKIKDFNKEADYLRKIPRKDLYYEFYIPKKSGGLRRIDAPNDNLKEQLSKLVDIFKNDFCALYHTSAFAYIEGRCTIDALKRHQSNNSKWFGKYDLSNFFGSTTLEFVMNMFSMIFPFSEVIKDEEGKKELEMALELAFMDGVLPQGTPASPLITTIMMIPIDFCLNRKLIEHNHQRFIYTRYADDFQISSRYGFNFKEIENIISETLNEFGAPFKINKEKTRYGSSSGQNWNLGLMLNKDNDITVGYKNKKRFQAMVSSYVMDKKNGISWEINDIQRLDGIRSYYKSVEGEKIDSIIEHLSQKFNVNIMKMIKKDLNPNYTYD